MSFLFLFPALQIVTWLVLIHLDIGSEKESSPPKEIESHEDSCLEKAA